MKKSYAAPQISDLGSAATLTQGVGNNNSDNGNMESNINGTKS